MFIYLYIYAVVYISCVRPNFSVIFWALSWSQ